MRFHRAALPLSGGTLTGVLLLPDGLTTAPALAFSSNVDVGMYLDTDRISFTFDGTTRFRIDNSGVNSNDAAGPIMKYSAASSTNPVFVPDRGDSNTGIGQAGADLLSLITGGVEAIRLDASQNMISGANAGTAGSGTTATEYGDSHHHLTRLAMAGTLPDIVGGAAEAEGLLVYTFPAGVILVDAVHMDVGITQSEGNIDADTPKVGVGSVIATGSVNALAGTAAFMDYVTEQTAANCTGTVTDKSTELTAGGSSLIEAGGEHKVHFNVADDWAANGDAAATLSGNIWIAWRFLGA